MYHKLFDHPQRFMLFITFITSLAGLLFGFDTGVIAGALPFIQTTFTPSTGQSEFIVSVTVLGALIGALLSGRLSDKFGRRKILMITSLTFIIGTSIAMMATSIDQLIIGRLILGLAIGAASYIAPLFIAEISPAKLRGRLILLNVVSITMGQAISYLIDYYFTATHNWRAMIAMGLFPSFLLLFGMILSPNSPRWLFFSGKKKEAFKVLSQIRHGDDLKKELQIISNHHSKKQNHWKAILTKKLQPVLWIGLLLGIFQQFVGINTIMYYGPIIFSKMGFHNTSSQILGTFGLGVINTVFTIITIVLVDHWGRRRLLISGTFIASLSLIIIGTLLKYHGHVIKYFSVIALVTYMAGYAISLGGLFWVLISEIFPLHVRGLCMSMVTAIQWGANFLIASTFLTILHAFGANYTFYLYAIMSLFACIFSYYFIPETKNTSLEQIEKNLTDSKSIRELGHSTFS